MKSKFTAGMAIVLLFIFAFATVVTVYSNVSAESKPEYSCCHYRVCPEITPAVFNKGVWINGYCTFYPPSNPNNCPRLLILCP